MIVRRDCAIALIALAAWSTAAPAQPEQPMLGTRSIPLITQDGLRFKDMNRNGKLDPYEDWRLSSLERAKDLVTRMTLAEKVGTMMHGTAPSVGGSYGEGTQYNLGKARDIVIERNVTTMVTRLDTAPGALAKENNALQTLAETGRLGIPIIVSTDPRNYLQFTRGASIAGRGFSKWPGPLGFASIGDLALTRHFADIVRREYRAVGIREALSPQADLATEPRWPRIDGTFGEDARIVSDQVRAYVTGIQGGADGLSARSVIAVAKHWVGYGAAAEGYDSHNSYGRYSVFPGNNLTEHVRAFQGAFDAHVGGIMPTYSILKNVSLEGNKVEQVGAGFSHTLLTRSLRGAHGYKGLIVSDFAITEDCNDACLNGSKAGEPFGVSMAWGTEKLSKINRFTLGVRAGLDQFGGTEDVEPLIAAVEKKMILQARLDESAIRVMEQKFDLGLFEQPFVDEHAAAQIVGTTAVQAEARLAQGRAMVTLKNANVLPLAKGTRVYLSGVDADVAKARGLSVVEHPSQAQIALVRLQAPFQKLHPGYMFGSVQHEGDLDFKPDDIVYRKVLEVSAKIPTIVFVYLDRPAILTELNEKVQALYGEFGANDDAVLDVAFGETSPQGKLPFELPRSMDAVRKQRSDLPHDSVSPLFRKGF